jgi:hypothetical protein
MTSAMAASVQLSYPGGTMPKEPQSYGSQGDWVSGHVDGELNEPKNDSPQRTGGSSDDRGGKVSESAAGDKPAPIPQTSDDERDPVQKVTGLKTGAKRESYFKTRDYRR